MQENKPKLTPQQIKEKRRQKILQRAAKQKKQQIQQPVVIPEVKEQKQSKPAQYQQRTNQKPNKKEQVQQQQGQQDAFQRFNQMLRSEATDKMMKLFSKLIGFIVAMVHICFMYNLWTYHNKKLNKEINQAEFQLVKNKFSSENNIVFFTMLALIYLIWYLVKSNKKSNSKKQTFQILPGSTIVQILQKLNKVLGYKIFLQFLASYITSYIVTVLITGQILSMLGSGQWFYWNLDQTYNPIKANQDILL